MVLLCDACRSYDRGFRVIGKHIALSLRVLLHEYGPSRALLGQLEFLDIPFLDTAGPVHPDNPLTECTLCVIAIGPAGATYIPKFVGGGGVAPSRWVTFAEWWDMPVIKDQGNAIFTRRQIVLHVAETDGGAHVDPKLDEAYLRLSRENSLGWVLSDGNIEVPFPGPELRCMRQIAYEVISTMTRAAPGRSLQKGSG
jgi:hypothetical protein